MKLLYSICILLVSLYLKGQDIHFSEFWGHPVFQNPAFVGQFDGTYRVCAIQRLQHRSVSKPYNTTGLSGERRNLLINGLNLSANFLHDQDGTSRLKTIEFLISASYIYSKGKNQLSAGLSLGVNGRLINESDLTWDEQYLDFEFNNANPITESFSTNQKWNFQGAVGFSYQYSFTRVRTIRFGMGAFNLFGMDQGFFGVERIRPIRLNFSLDSEWKLTEDLDVLPGFQANFQQSYIETIYGGQVRYWMTVNRTEPLALRGGLYYRTIDALVLAIGGEFREWELGVSYDINLSKLTQASTGRGGFEIYLIYVWKEFKPDKIQKRVCPDYY